jgi:pimeloyl-ACP methyl ester carboxylesterase
LDPVSAYWLDRWQRTILTLDVLRQRGNIHNAQAAKIAPHVLSFQVELICDGRTLPRPVNYALVKIVPPPKAVIDPAKPPFVVVDPRAGHGPGIGGMKQDSEIGVAMAAGHAAYFVGFTTDPVPGQTIEDVWEAEAAFLEIAAARHANADGKPVVIANCQAGWQTMIMAALHPELCGAVMIAGSPLSYWAGVRGANPMRYLGGLMGGTWMAALGGDLGAGIADGANLVANFESLDLANTYWSKPYNLFANVDTEAPRFLQFETWWGSPVLLNAGELQWITDNLFVGNRLSLGALRNAERVRIDLRNIRAPIVVFCSHGDNITPPQQALGWITDLYENDDEIVANGQTIVYNLHQNIGHLGIFVSGRVASREHAEFASCMGMVEVMPPGLYEAVITEAADDTPARELIDGLYLFRLERRSLDDIRALGANTVEEDRCFAAVERVSERGLALYRTLAAPAVQALVTAPMAEALRQFHPNRLRFSAFSDDNPAMRMIAPLAEEVRAARQPAPEDNPLLLWEQTFANLIASSLDTLGRIRDTAEEALFFAIYGSPLLQAMIGLTADAGGDGRRIERDLVREADQAQLRTDLEQRFETGGPVEACLRALVYVRLPDGAADERTFNLLRHLRAGQPPTARHAMAELKQTLKDQFLLVALDAERAVRALPGLLPTEAAERTRLWNLLQDVLTAPGPLSAEGQRRLRNVQRLFDLGSKPAKEGQNA